MDDHDALPLGALFLGGGVAYAASRWLAARPAHASATAVATAAAREASAPMPAPTPAPARRPTPAPTPAPSRAPTSTIDSAAPVSSPSEIDPGPITSPSQVDPGDRSATAATAAPSTSPIDPYPTTRPTRVPSSPPLSRAFDPVFERYRDGIPIEYLRALATRESDMKPAERSGAAWGLLQIVEDVRGGYNHAHGTHYTREHLLDPAVNVAMACWLLRTIIASYAKHHPDVPNLRADWNNRQFVELLTYGWNAGYSEGGGVGHVARYLARRGVTDLTIDMVHTYAPAAGASRHLRRADKVRWCKGVASLYERERRASARALRGAESGARGVFDAGIAAANVAAGAVADVSRPLLIGAGVVGAGVLAITLLRK